MTFTLDLTPLRRALTSLEDSLRVTEDVAWLQAQSDAVRNTLFAGVIQNFEFVYELATKMLKRQIEAEAATPGETDQLGFRDLLRVPPRQNSCRVDRTRRGGEDEEKTWRDTARNTRTGWWQDCCRRRVPRWSGCPRRWA